jgi:hypothetical protein
MIVVGEPFWRDGAKVYKSLSSSEKLNAMSSMIWALVVTSIILLVLIRDGL